METETKHTREPWELRETHEDQIEISTKSRAGMAPIATVEVGFKEPFDSEQRAYARLIAAAPDLLAALEADEAAFAMTIGDGRDHATRARRKLEATVKARQMMRAALAKARGEV